MKKNWDKVRLGDILTLEYGKSLPEKERTPGDYRVFGSNGAVGYHEKALLHGPVIIVGRKGSVGSVRMSQEPCWPIDTTYWVKPKRALSTKWLFEYLCHAKLNRLNEASGVPGLNRENAYRLNMPFPPIAEQERIAEILSDADAAITTMEKISEKQHEKHKTISSFLFANKEIGNSVELSEICKISTGKKDVKEGNPNGVYPFFTCSKENTYSDSYSFDAEAILIAGNANIGNPRCFKGKFEAYQRTYVLTEFKGIQPIFLCEFLAIALSKRIAKEKQNSVISYIKLKTLSSMNIPLASAELQEKCAKIFRLLAEEKMKTENQIATLKKQKRGLMQQLLTGKLRLSPKKGKEK